MTRICRVCDRPVQGSAGFCHTHNERWRRWGKPDPAAWAEAFLAGCLNTCAVCGVGFNGHFRCRHCSPECLATYKRGVSLARWRSLSKEERKAASRRAVIRNHAKRQQRRVDKTCVSCGVSFRGWHYQVLCGQPECQRAYTRHHQQMCRRRQAEASLRTAAEQLQRKFDDP